MAVKILWLSDCPLLATGFGRVTRELTIRLAKHPDLEIVCLGVGFDGWPYDQALYPIKVYPSLASTYGEDHFERVVNEFRPDVVITLGEMWMFQWMSTHPVRGQFRWIAYVPIDGAPLYEPWVPLIQGIDEVVTMSDFGRSVIQAGVPSKRIHRIYHGVDTETFRPLPDRERLRDHDRCRGKFVVGCVARNQPRKNIPALVKAFAQLNELHSDTYLYLHMSPCDIGYDLVTLLRRYRLQDRADVSTPELSLSCALNDSDLNRLYNFFDVTVLASNGEGFGLPIIESMAAGVPVVATDYSACSELVRGRGELARILGTQTLGNNLIEHAIVDVDDLARCIERLYLNPTLLETYGKAGREYACNLAWEKLIPQWLEVISLATGFNLSLSHGPESRPG
ncbi:MAG: glycosyltransferase family 4 protein [Verrucomicrobiales bacterium]|nr:glycosyltransferase family 4 protein [Verrucomicrobiales bacterium]